MNIRDFVFENNIMVFLSNMMVGISSFLISLYIYCKSMKRKPVKSGKQVILISAAAVLIAACYAVLCIINIAVATMALYLSLSFFLLMFEKERRFIRCINGFISTSLMHLLKIISAILVSVVLFHSPVPPIGIISYAALFALTFLFALLLFKNRRLSNGIGFLNHPEHLGPGMVLSGVIFILANVSFLDSVEISVFYLIVIIGILIFGAGLYLWIRRGITAHYRKRMKLRTEEHYQQTLAENEQKLRQLEQSNEFLAKVVHRDNHLMSALNNAIDAYFDSDDSEFKDDLLREIQTLSNERTELIAQEQRGSKILPTTGNLLIDGAVNDLYIQAAAHGIDFHLDVAAPVDEIIGRYLSQTELQTLLCDHIKDAIIAVVAAGEGKGKILVRLSAREKHYEITIFDSGVDFEIETLAKLGRERVTTHADSGGSGIGFMTTFETLRKACASLIITEPENKSPFSKWISFHFDGESAFVIHSYRAEELKAALNRTDVVVLSMPFSGNNSSLQIQTPVPNPHSSCAAS